MDSICLDTHLNSPLSITILQEALRTVGKCRTNQVEIVKEEVNRVLSFLDCSVPSQNHPQILIPEFMMLVKKVNLGIPSCGDLQKYLDMLSSFVPYHLTKLKLDKDPVFFGKIIKDLNSHKLFPEVTGLYNLRCFFEQGVCLSAKPLKFSRESSLKEWKYWTKIDEKNDLWLGILSSKQFNLTVIIGRNICYLKYQDVEFLSSRNHFLMMSDILAQRLLCYISCIWAESLHKTNYPLASTLQKTFEYGDILLKTFKNPGYKSIALWESLIIGHLLKRSEDQAVDSSIFYDTMKQELRNSQEETDQDFLENHFNQFEKLLELQNPDQLLQLFGLYRIWGHPTIDEREGMKKLKDVSCKPRAVNQDFINLMTWKWREYFCLSFYARHNRWPALTLNRPVLDSILLKALASAEPITTMTPGYKLEDWKYIEFDKNFDVPEKFELSEMIADKATSHNVSDLIRSCIKDGTIGASYTRSVILKWLNTNYNDPEEFLNQINNQGFSKEEKCVGLHPKERELKVYARMFGLLTIEKRLYVVLTEAMLAENLFVYFPEITMTFDSVTLQHRIYSNTRYHCKKGSSQSQGYHVITNLDFMKWNQYMRESETKQLFKDFDRLFGYTKVFSRTHEMFNDSYIYLADGTFTPFINGQAQLGDLMWVGHLGGIEGLRQKGWTIFTVVLLKYITEVYGVNCQIMGQGDNQVVIFEYNLDSIDAVRELHQTVILGLRTALIHIGPPLKLEETWSSSQFFIYGKFPVWKGKPLSLSLKKLCRTMRLTNEGFQNLESTLSSITANASAATASDHDPIIPYLIGSLETVGAILLHWQHPFYQNGNMSVTKQTKVSIPTGGIRQLISLNLSEYARKLIRDDTELMVICVANFPCILGGYPSLQLCDLMNHGFPDPLSLNLWSLKELYHELPGDQTVLHKAILNMINPIMNPESNYEMLCQDPVSLNLLHSSSGSEKIKRMVFDFMTSALNVKNKQFLTFLQLAKQRQKDLTAALATMTPMNPRVAHSILSSTIVGRAMKVVSKVNKTKTLIGLMLRTADSSRILQEHLGNENEEYFESNLLVKKKKPIAELFGNFERNFFMSVLMGIFSHRELFHRQMDFCSTAHAQNLRLHSWKLPISGVTVMVPAECFNWFPSQGFDCTTQNHLSSDLGYIQVITDLDDSLLHQTDFTIQQMEVGPFKPFFGSTTVNKIQYEGKNLKAVAPPILKGALELLGLIGWGAEHESNLASLICSIFSSFTDLDPLNYIPEPGAVSGSVEHRWQDRSTSHASSLSILYLACTHFTVITNNFKPHLLPHCQLATNFNISFQTIFTWISCLWSSKLIYTPTYLKKSYHLHVSCLQCIQPINESKLEIDPNEELISTISSSTDPSNIYCWIPKERLLGPELNFQALLTGNPDHLSGDQLQHILNLYATELYLNEFSLQAASSQVKMILRENTKYIPVNVLGDLNYHSFFTTLSLYIVLQYYFLRITSITNLTTSSVPLGDILDQVSRLPLMWFSGMQSLLLNHNSMLYLIKRNPGINLPLGSPPSLNEKCKFFQLITLNYIRSLGSNTRVLKLIRLFLKNPSIQSSNILFNPQMMYILEKCFSSNRYISRSGIMFLAELRLFHQQTVERHSFTSMLDLSTIKFNLLQFLRLQELVRIQRELDDFEYFPLIKSSLDAISKKLSPYKRDMAKVHDPAESNPFNVPDIDISSLPQASSIIFYSTSGTNNQMSSLTIPISISFPNKISLRNHYFKASTPITTAAYKPLSVLQSLFSKHDIVIDNCERTTLGSFGDGSGGYTLLLGRIFNNCQLLMNTLFDSSLLSSSGIDNYVPAAPGMVPSVWTRMIQKNIIIEGVSDITNETFHTTYCDLELDMQIIICDAEGEGWENPLKAMKMIGKLLEIAATSHTRVFIFKTYASSLDALYAQYILISQYYYNVEIIRSWFSSYGNTEVFLCGIGLKKFQGKIGFYIDNLSSNSRISIHGHFLVPCEFTQFSQQFGGLVIYKTKPDTIAAQYDTVLSIPSWTEGCKNLLYQTLFPFVSEGSIRFPSALISKYRKELHLVKFTHDVLSRYRFNFLTKRVMQDICFDYYLQLGILVKSVGDVELLLESIDRGWFCFFETVDRSWAFSWRSEEPSWMNTKNVKVKDILRPAKVKELIVSWKRLHDLNLSLIPSSISLNQPYVHHCGELREWYLTPHLPLSMTPILRYTVDKDTGSKIPAPVCLIYQSKFSKSDRYSNLDLLEETGLIKLHTRDGKLVKLQQKEIQISKEQIIINKLLKPCRLN